MAKRRRKRRYTHRVVTDVAANWPEQAEIDEITARTTAIRDGWDEPTRRARALGSGYSINDETWETYYGVRIQEVSLLDLGASESQALIQEAGSGCNSFDNLIRAYEEAHDGREEWNGRTNTDAGNTHSGCDSPAGAAAGDARR